MRTERGKKYCFVLFSLDLQTAWANLIKRWVQIIEPARESQINLRRVRRPV